MAAVKVLVMVLLDSFNKTYTLSDHRCSHSEEENTVEKR